MYVLHLIGILLIIAMIATGSVLVLQIMKLEKEIIAEKNERTGEAANSGAVIDT
jgi:L-asparagine transporter-like permease